MNLASMGDLAEREPFYLLKKKQDVEPSSEEEETSSEEEKQSDEKVPPPDQQVSKSLPAFIYIKGSDYLEKEDPVLLAKLERKRQREEKKRLKEAKLRENPKIAPLNKFLSPPKETPELLEDEPIEDNYKRREYYGVIPIDGHLYSHDLNSASKKFVMTYLHDHFENVME